MFIFIISCTAIALFLAFHTYCTKIYQDITGKEEESSNSISLPPEIPKVTPPVICEGVQLGIATYYNKEYPVHIVDVSGVYDGCVCFMNSHDDKMGVDALPVADFLLKYALREQTSISTL